MAITGAWKERQGIQVGALKWGTGVDTVHYDRDIQGRNVAPVDHSDAPPESITHEAHDSFFDSNDDDRLLWGYGVQTGTAERPPVGTETQQFRGSNNNDYPHWGKYAQGVPGGTAVRSENIGATLTQTPKQEPVYSATDGWENKLTGQVDDAEQSDVSQLFMQTSMTQRDQVRAGSQMAAGRANEFDAPIASRIPGQKIKTLAGGPERHYDMFPRQQFEYIRAWWTRQAGTGRVADMQVNEAYESRPLTRDVPADPYTGPSVPISSNYGYVSEDVIPYA